MKHLRAFSPLLLLAVLLLAACSDDDHFSSSPSNVLHFSVDSVRMDTLFSRVPSSTRTFWVYNRSGSGIRCQSVRLAQGNQTGFRVNVDGLYLGATEGYQTGDIEVRNGDSIRVFVEVTTPLMGQDGPRKVVDDLIFTLESGVEQRMPLVAWAWDAQLLTDVHIQRDSTLASTRPIVIYGGITVDEGATLSILGTTLYFHGDAGIDVSGRLLTDALDGRETVLRGDRLDRMFDYLPYDRVSGQWQGIRIRPTSYGNELRYTDIHSAFDGIVCDSAACDSSLVRLTLDHATIHNCQGYGLLAHNAHIVVNTCQITNTLGSCLSVEGGIADVRNSTLAQFYPFDAARGAALHFTNALSDVRLFAANNIITGYADDQLAGERGDEHAFDYHFENCLIRTPRVNDDSLHFVNVIFEEATDTAQAGKRNFVGIDEQNLDYNFALSPTSKAVGAASTAYSLPTDRLGRPRDDDHPDIGAYEHTEKNP